MGNKAATPEKIRIADLPTGKPTAFELVPDAAARAALAEALDILKISKLRFSGTLTPRGKRDWQLDAQLGATVQQSCIVTLEPVTTRIDEPVARTYLADMPEPEIEAGAEIEMPQDDSIEALPATLDLGAVVAEALSLALPAYPRAPGATLEGAQVTEPGKAPLSDEDTKPFAALKSLKDKLQDPG